MASTKAINLRIELEHEQLVRDVIARIRTGGPGFRSALKALIDDDGAAEYVPAREINARFADLERRVATADENGGNSATAERIEERFAALEEKLKTAVEETSLNFVGAPEVLSRFARLEKRLGMTGENGEEFVPARHIEKRFSDIETAIARQVEGASATYVPENKIREMFELIEARLKRLESS